MPEGASCFGGVGPSMEPRCGVRQRIGRGARQRRRGSEQTNRWRVPLQARPSRPKAKGASSSVARPKFTNVATPENRSPCARSGAVGAGKGLVPVESVLAAVTEAPRVPLRELPAIGCGHVVVERAVLTGPVLFGAELRFPMPRDSFLGLGKCRVTW